MKHFTLPTSADCPEAVVLVAGDYPTSPLPLALLRRAHHIICCDGAADEYISRGFVPDAIVGDGDSLSASHRITYADKLHFTPSDQETNDQTKAVQYCISQGIREIILLGATGKREDHTLGNISLLMEYMDKVHVQMVTDYGVFTPAAGNATFQSTAGMQVSVFNFGATALQAEGLKYPLSDFSNWWQGTLNEATKEQFSISAAGRYLVFRAITGL